MSAHTHDHVDWAARLPTMRRADALAAEAHALVAARLTADLPERATVVDAGCGTGGMSAALAAQLGSQAGGESGRQSGAVLVLVDATEELLTAAEKVATLAAGPNVRIETVVADVADGRLRELVPAADLIWASSMVHHLPDQQAGVTELAGGLRPGGLLAIAEGGLETRCLPRELGIGEPGLEHRLLAARNYWFAEMRAGMEGAVSMPYGWNIALGNAGLGDVAAFSYLTDFPAPGSEAVRGFVVDRVTWLAEVAGERLSDDDRETVRRLTDPEDPAYLGTRDDIFLLDTRTVHHGRSK
jgi:SAM-dependent methyltransferase